MRFLSYFTPTDHRRVNEFIGLLLLTLALLAGLSLVSFDPADPSLNVSKNPRFDTKANNFIGPVGSYFSDLLLQGLGFSGFLLPVFLGIYAFYWIASWRVQNFLARLAGVILLVLSLSTVFGLSPSIPRIRGYVPAGGVIGKWLAQGLESAVNLGGAVVILMALLLVSLFLATSRFSLLWIVDRVRPRFEAVNLKIQAWSERREERRKERIRASLEAKAARKAPLSNPQSHGDIKRLRPATVTDPEFVDVEETVRVEPPIVIEPEPSRPSARSRERAPARPANGGVAATAAAKALQKTDFPSTALLEPVQPVVAVNENELRERARMVEQKCEEFEVDGVVQQIHPGPVVTTYEFKPEAGVKYARITGLSDDLCLGLEAESVRIDRIPGKSTVGIEVPNDERATIMLREILESSEYQKSGARLPLALGKDIRGKIVVSDLQKMPHLLAAGSTGTGKSVSLNAMILSLLFRSRPDQVKLILIDPKRLELGLYQDIPHLMVPVVTEPKVAQNVLKWAVGEMEGRYKKLAKRNVRNLEVYNEQIRQLPIPGLESVDEVQDREPLPYIVIVIDELADLMMVASREVEESITRLAQMARAVGIHLILATQRPSVDVITGLIKANFPARISFRVASKVDSRTILDSNGAEQLLGRGDMLFLPPGSSRLMRVHGPYVSEDEVQRVCDFLKAQGKPVYNEKILESPDEQNGEADTDGESDPLYDEAVRLVLQMGKASTSALQRRLRVGYGRAASLLDAMEHARIIGPPDGSKPREVLIKPQEFFGDEGVGVG